MRTLRVIIDSDCRGKNEVYSAIKMLLLMYRHACYNIELHFTDQLVREFLYNLRFPSIGTEYAKPRIAEEYRMGIKKVPVVITKTQICENALPKFEADPKFKEKLNNLTKSHRIPDSWPTLLVAKRSIRKELKEMNLRLPYQNMQNRSDYKEWRAQPEHDAPAIHPYWVYTNNNFLAERTTLVRSMAREAAFLLAENKFPKEIIDRFTKTFDFQILPNDMAAALFIGFGVLPIPEVVHETPFRPRQNLGDDSILCLIDKLGSTKYESTLVISGDKKLLSNIRSAKQFGKIESIEPIVQSLQFANIDHPENIMAVNSKDLMKHFYAELERIFQLKLDVPQYSAASGKHGQKTPQIDIPEQQLKRLPFLSGLNEMLSQASTKPLLSHKAPVNQR